jgi:hypothetical protein
VTFEPKSKLTEIEAKVFSDCFLLGPITIPASVKKIHGSAFKCCPRLKIAVEEGSTDFASCGNFVINVPATSRVRYFGHKPAVTLSSEIESLCTKHFSPSSLTFEPGLKLRRIDAGAFFKSDRLKSILVPASVESLGDECFGQCMSLSSVTFESESKLLQIGARALVDCSYLESISVPASVESLGDKCFGWCRSLSSVKFGPESKLAQIGARAFFLCSELGSISIPASVVSLGDKCFWRCDSLSSVEFGSESKLVQIGARAFALCSELKSISVPASVQILGDECFSMCHSLSLVQFDSGSNLVQINARAFAGCLSLKSIVIPRRIQKLVKDWAIASSLEYVTFESAASLQGMIDSDCVDLTGCFTIRIDDWDSDSDIDTLRSSIGRRFEHFSHLVD